MKLCFDNAVLLSELAKLLREGYTVTIPVRGNSMLPFLADGRDGVTLVRCPSDELPCGAVVLARTTDGRIVLHRIVRRDGERLWLQGDGNVRGAEQALGADVMAVAVAFVRKGRIYPATGRAWRVYSWIWRHGGRMGRRYALALYRRMAGKWQLCV